ncbi:hypothetical protein IMZ31_24210 (plasmid) [Pontibacillus sp. ALD_SL1]|uniref:hypothetical protein n=1 Tax=Pontibacillus sp. ALD_SL1 TaxID=2777185 RepID=UPI001A978BD6|nr:hypothetical protein [Pontibacillus sp. ALD_SL1]QST02557.1 hypothetical protein IMZ31_24210 [Pontibacillus sp. ALD_SL1]
MKTPYYEIVDSKGVISSPIGDLSEAFEELRGLKEEGFEFQGDVKIVEVHHQE